MASNRANERCDLSTVDILLGARHLIEAGWCQGATATDAQGRAVDPSFPTAVMFDPLGAIERAVLNLFQGDDRYWVQNYYKGFYTIAAGLHTHAAIAAWNDDPLRRKAEILASFDLAIEQSSIPPVPNTPKVAA
jgi:hypothetical protein